MNDRMTGTSLLPLLDGDGSEVQIDGAVTEKRVRDTEVLRIGLRTDQWKFLYDGTTEETVLYDLEADPDEQTDVSDTNPDVTERFEAELTDRFDRIRETTASVDIPTFDVDAGTEERLRALGYKD
jgi:arylsulfatase A-like enzyme